ncbi:hypothetical protein BDQ17DRAFT_1537518 [Cyathus striatus]|nr:hypothetical protein BDQ17DRAFT_1537518 [Cyathus striatus]
MSSPSPKMPSSTYPEEIIEEILSHLSDDMQSLRMCTLVSQFFYSIAVRQLFSVIDFNASRVSRHQFKRFYQVLKDSPRAKRLTSAVTVFKLLACCNFVDDDGNRLPVVPHFIYTDPEKIAWILSIMENIQSLLINLYSTSITPPVAPPDSVLRQIEHTIMYGNLTSLMLRGIPIRYGHELLEIIKIITNSPSAVLSLSELRSIVISRTASTDDLSALENLLSQVSKAPIDTLKIQLGWSNDSVLSSTAISNVKHMTLRSPLPANTIPIIKNVPSNAIIQTIQLRFWLNNSCEVEIALETEFLKLVERVATVEKICIHIHVPTGCSNGHGCCTTSQACDAEKQLINKFTATREQPLFEFEHLHHV